MKRNYYQEHKEEINLKAKTYYKCNKDKYKKRYRLNKNKKIRKDVDSDIHEIEDNFIWNAF